MPTNDDLEYRTATATEYYATPLLRLLAGDRVAAGQLFTGVANADTKRLVVENGFTDTALAVLEPTVRSSGQFFTGKRINPTIDTAGDAVTTYNPKSDASVPAAFSATMAGDGETGAISGGEQYPQTTSGSGTNAANADPGDSGAPGVSDVVMPGDTLAVSASNESGSTQDISITVEVALFPTADIDALPF